MKAWTRSLASRIVFGLTASTVVIPPGVVAAQSEPSQVADLAVVQDDGFATLTWEPVDGATDYQIERTPIDGDGVPTGPAVISGVWRPNRQVHPESPSFADAGFNLGERFQWRVRARFGTEPQPFSDPVVATTRAPFGPQEFLTQFEITQGAQFTSYESEIDWTRRIDAASDRVRVVTIGHTALGRVINLFIVGYPTPLATAPEISAAPSAGANCNVHGNEPSGREGCFMAIRELAFSDDPHVIDILSNATVLFVPSINGDGRAANTRGNSTGQDLNRDYGRLSQPETFAMIEFWRDYTPEVMVDNHEFGNNSTCDLPSMSTPHRNNAPSTYSEAKIGLVEGWRYEEGAADGWWPCPYPVAFSPGGQSFGSTSGLKHIIGMLVEARSSGGPTRPNEGNTQNNRRRKAYSHLWTVRRTLDYHRANRPRIQEAIADSIAFQRANTGPVVFDGTVDWPAFPPPHPGENPPPNNRPDAGDMLEDPPCGYFLSEEQYTTPLDDGGGLPPELWTTAAQRLEAHGATVEHRPAGHIVRMAQPLRGLIPLILDGRTEELGAPIITAGQRLFECPNAAVTPGRLDVTVDGARSVETLTVGNQAVELDEPLVWSITESAGDCAAPSDLSWVAIGTSSGTTPSSSNTDVDVAFDATGLTVGEVRSGALCLSSNDPGAPQITVPVSLQVECARTVSGPRSGPLTVSSGVTCIDGATVIGPVTVTPGAGLLVHSARIEGPVDINGATIVTVCDSSVIGPVRSTGTSSITLGDPTVDCVPNDVSGPLSVRDTTGPSVIAGNRIDGPLACSGNIPAPVNKGFPNNVTGARSGQCRTL